jgi:hypothetical protein
MRHKSDFPALSESVGAINRITLGESEHFRCLEHDPQGFSLTNKILRMVNSAYYRQAGGGNISTVSRAVVVLGLDAVRSIAITVMLFDHLQNKDNSRSTQGRVPARQSGRCSGQGHRQQDIGTAGSRAGLHLLDVPQPGAFAEPVLFPEESAEIRRLMQQKNCSEDAAALQVLGISHEDLGIAIAQTWGFPRLIVNSMRKLPAGSIRRPPTRKRDRVRVSGLVQRVVYAGRGCDARTAAKELRRLVTRFAEVARSRRAGPAANSGEVVRAGVAVCRARFT